MSTISVLEATTLEMGQAALLSRVPSSRPQGVMKRPGQQQVDPAWPSPSISRLIDLASSERITQMLAEWDTKGLR